MESCPLIKNILLLDSEGKRVAVKYYSDDWPTLASKLAFEKSVFTKTQKTNARAEVLQGFFDAVALLLRSNVEKRTALENLDLILLCLDEIVDGGIILETEPSLIAGKVVTHGADGGGAPLSEQTISQALASAREHLARSLLK